MTSSCLSLFPTPVYVVKLDEETLLTDAFKKRLEKVFEQQQNEPQHPLELGNALSTWADSTLDSLEEIQGLKRIVLLHAQEYWKMLGHDEKRKLVISRLWANYHEEGGTTLEHNHSPVHINAVCYVSVPPSSGHLQLRNPLEYHLGSSPFGPPYSDRLWHTQEVAAGDLILMPGWLKHRTEKSRSRERRVVITFNINGVLQ